MEIEMECGEDMAGMAENGNDLKKQALIEALKKVRKLMVELAMGNGNEAPDSTETGANVVEKGSANDELGTQMDAETETAAIQGGGQKVLGEMAGTDEGSLDAIMAKFMNEKPAPLDRKARFGGGGIAENMKARRRA